MIINMDAGERNRLIFEEYQKDKPVLSVLSKKYGLSESRIHQILKKKRLTDYTKRGVQGGDLRVLVEQFKHLTQYSQEDLAQWLGTDARTVSEIADGKRGGNVQKVALQYAMIRLIDKKVHRLQELRDLIEVGMDA